MKRDYIIDSFIQQLYNCYNISDMSISYGYNEVSETYIVKIDNKEVMDREDFQRDIFLFSQERADANVWVMFMSPDDCINFSEFEPVAKEYTAIIPSSIDDVCQAIQDMPFGDNGWLLSSSSHKISGELNRVFSDANHPQQYAMAA